MLEPQLQLPVAEGATFRAGPHSTFERRWGGWVRVWDDGREVHVSEHTAQGLLNRYHRKGA